MSKPAFERVALIGIGLIGSSLARVLRRDGLAGEIVACARRAETRAKALELGIVDRAIEDAGRGGAGADLVVLATPLSAYAGDRRAHRRGAAPGRHRHRCRLGQAGGDPRSRAGAAGQRPLRSRPSRRRHRAFRPRIGLRRAVPRPLVHPDAAARHRCRRARPRDGALGAGRHEGRDHGCRASRQGAGHDLASAASSSPTPSSAPRPISRRASNPRSSSSRPAAFATSPASPAPTR